MDIFLKEAIALPPRHNSTGNAMRFAKKGKGVIGYG